MSDVHHKVSPFQLHSIEGLARYLREPQLKKNVIGTTNTAALAEVLSQRALLKEQAFPILIVVPHERDAEQLIQDLRFFDSQIRTFTLPSFDVSPYSQLYPNRRVIAGRLQWLHQAQNCLPGDVFIATGSALIQKTLPFDLLAHRTSTFRVGDTLPHDLRSILESLGYQATPLVEDVGTYSIRGSIVDIYSPAHERPVRLELFGDQIDSMKLFEASTQRSIQPQNQLSIIPARETLWSDESIEHATKILRQDFQSREVDPEEARQILSATAKGQYVYGAEFLIGSFYDRPAQPLEHFSSPLEIWVIDSVECLRATDELWGQLRQDFKDSNKIGIRPLPESLFVGFDDLQFPVESLRIDVAKIQIDSAADVQGYQLRVGDLREIAKQAKALTSQTHELQRFVQERLTAFRSQGHKVFIAAGNTSQAQRLYAFLERCEFQTIVVSEDEQLWADWASDQDRNIHLIHVIPHALSSSFIWAEENLVFLRDEDFFGRKRARREYQESGSLEKRVGALSFGDLKVGDFVVHKLHGVGIYEGLKVMPIGGVDSEFIQLSYKDKDRLYLPVYRIGQIQKYSGPTAPHLLDRLGGQSFEKTKTKVRAHLRDVAADLLQLYAKRSQVTREPFTGRDDDYQAFESGFPYEETPDQLRAVEDIMKDLTSERPMDRLICGDVGFGKTEIAMRAAFKAVEDKKQVCVIAPTTVLTFQHLETFQKRFKRWPVVIKNLNRFVPKREQTQTLQKLKTGEVDIIIGTHRLLSRDVEFKNLGLLIIDEEQKFGVRHKERLRQMKASVDTLAMSATPIPRTLNMSLMGIRDLSIINTPPVDRLPTRTFVCKFDKETIRKAVLSEVARGGQIYFIHNRIQSIYALADELRQLLPEIKMRVGHGQMEESELEETVLQFLHHEIDMLVCTAIVESGMDVSRANTMFIDNAHHFGLSQLYQLRGRVGRSKERAYCYLLVPPNTRLDAEAQERLKVLQENTALGSGIRIAHYDLELRGAGDLLGEEQSGHIQAVGYELYLELLEQSVRSLKGEAAVEEIEPEINVRIAALIPDSYISDIRIRLAYYKALADIQGTDDLERIEDELRDQFGKPPESVMNLMGLMLIRRQCKSLAVRDISSGKAQISLSFTQQTSLPREAVIKLASRADKKYSITPDQRLNIRMNEMTWPRIYDELLYLEGLKH